MTLRRTLLSLILLQLLCFYHLQVGEAKKTKKAKKAKEAEEEKEEIVGDYLYGSDDPESVFPITEYVTDEDSTETNNFIRPDFLYSKKSGYRIVEFYAPWCAHCRAFKSHFIKFARTITKMVHDLGHEVSFHAISCTAHRPICRDNNVTSYPRIKVYKPGSISPTTFQAPDVHPLLIMGALGLAIDSEFEYEEEADTPPQLSKKGIRSHEKKQSNLENTHEIRDKKALYRDISNSFDFAMKNSIYTFKGNMTNTTEDAFIDWIRLLHSVLPPSLQVHKAVASVKNHIDEAVLSEEALIKAVNEYPPEEKGWSFACTHGDKFAGYTCGLWELFHLVTIGVVEWNSFVGDDDWSLWPLSEISDLIRNYVDHFFGCEVCRLNFLAMYDSCSHDRCVRLPSSAKGTTHIDWQQLPLWLWEVHNSVNVRLMKERAQKANIEVSHQDELDAMFPSRSQCPRCWRADESWDEEMVYKFLRLEYWPYDATSEKYGRDILSKGASEDLDDYIESWASRMLFFPVAIGTFFVVWAYSEKYKRDKTGRHKKVDY